MTRSGTNQLHGGIYEYVRDHIYDAAERFSTSDLFTYGYAGFGATLGGPIVLPHLYNGREKSFFFLSYEGLTLDQPSPSHDRPRAMSGRLPASSHRELINSSRNCDDRHRLRRHWQVRGEIGHRFHSHSTSIGDRNHRRARTRAAKVTSVFALNLIRRRI